MFLQQKQKADDYVHVLQKYANAAIQDDSYEVNNGGKIHVVESGKMAKAVIEHYTKSEPVK